MSCVVLLSFSRKGSLLLVVDDCAFRLFDVFMLIDDGLLLLLVGVMLLLLSPASIFGKRSWLYELELEEEEEEEQVVVAVDVSVVLLVVVVVC